MSNPSDESPSNPPEPPRSQEELRKRAVESFQKWIPTVWKGEVVCPVCGSHVWNTGEPVDLPARHSPGKAVTVMPVICATCSHTIFFNMVRAGLYRNDLPLDPDEIVLPPESQEDESEGGDGV